ncbi:hypothetical protein DFP85_1079 [Halomonas ventosae]|uniref:Uncharacterized protein n=1 Tax=Halomonas ventosae TaxID=229007 RepID=A0A4R6ZQ48_9GAMM|nr:hypothetical protein [Halomonas ventosae]TDR54239.1 hypothetical protein DFP85_1079 [Halomonas ventosae]
MTMPRRAQPTSRVAYHGKVSFAVRGDWHGYWFTPGVPVAMS